MPKTDENLWNSFAKLGKSSKNQYYLVRCKHCDPNGENLFEGRARTMKTHLKNCNNSSNALEDEQKGNVNERDDCDEVMSTFTSVSELRSQQSVRGKRGGRSDTSSSGTRGGSSDASSSTWLTSKKLKTYSIKTFLDRELTPTEEIKMRQRLVEMIADSGIPFQWIERQSTIRFFETIRPSVIKALPSRRVLGGRLLHEAAIRSRNEQLPEIRRLIEDVGVTGNFICDGYEDGAKNHILGSIFQALNKWISYDEALGDGRGNIIEMDEHHGIATAKLIESAFIKGSQDLGLLISSVVTDDAGQCQRAKRILALRFPHMYFGKCYAHQVNLVVKDVFKVVHVDLVTRVKALVKAYNKSGSKWLVRLTDRCKKLYGCSRSLLRIMDVRWNSAQSSFASVLRIRTALKLIQAEYGGVSDFPDAMMVDDVFFVQLRNAEQLLRPLTKASFVMQRESNSLADVLNIFGLLYQGFAKASQHADELKQLLQKRWEQQEQPMFLLAFLFHPKYANIFRSMARFERKLDSGKIIQYSFLYYKKFVGDLTETEGESFAVEVNDWVQNAVTDAPFLISLSPIQFWKALKHTCPFTSRLAIFLLSIVIQTATCERLFSAFGNFATKKRNRLHSQKVHHLAQVKRSVAKMDENAYNTAPTTRPRIILPTELPRVDTEGQNEVEIHDDSAVDIVESDTEGSENDCDDEEDDKIPYDWTTVFDELDRIDEQEYNESVHFINQAKATHMMNEVLRMKHSDGAEYRQTHPYPDHNVPNFPQEKLTGVRSIKFGFESLFPTSIEALDEFHIFEQ